MSRRQTRTLLALSLCLSLSATACFRKDLDGMVPDDWYALPEDGRPPAGNCGDESRAAKALDAIYSAQARALEQVDVPDASASAAPPENAPPNWVPWHLDAFLTDISVTVGGALGFLLFDGSYSAEVLWKPAASQAKAADRPRREGGAPAIVASANEKAPLLLQLEPAIRGVLASGRVTDEKKLRTTLGLATRDFRNVVDVLSSVEPDPRWNVVGYRLVINLDASGAVAAVAKVGIAAFVRLDWFRDPKRPAPVPPAPSDASPREALLGRNLVGLVRSLAADFDEISKESTPVTQAGFQVAEVRVGLGLSVGGDVGVVSTSGSVTGIVQFAPAEPSATAASSAPAPSKAELPETIPFFATRPDQLAWASKVRISSAPLFLSGSKSGGAVFQIDRAKLRQGLRKAARLGGFFVRHAGRAGNRKWAIAEIVTAYELSVSGTLGLVTVSGAPSLEILHTRIASKGGSP